MRIGFFHLIFALAAASAHAIAGPIPDEDQEPINYSTAPVNDPIARLQRRIDSGQTKMEWDKERGYLPATLKNLGIDASSQTLVFSKTSFQLSLIAPAHPRALYFNDDVYLGWVQTGRVLEIASVDEQQGVIFYSVDQQRTPDGAPKFRRLVDDCRVCHSGSMTGNVPGLMVRSVFANRVGEIIPRSRSSFIDHSSPLSQRWGGWYVTGKSGNQRHMGNLTVGSEAAIDSADFSIGTNVTDLSKLFDVKPYLTPHSDIVALMVLEHQARGHNLLIRANWETRRAMWESQKFLGKEWHSNEQVDRGNASRIRSVCEPLVMYLLFADEIKLTAPISGTSTFAEDFARRGPRDSQGRSLRDLDLNRRLLKYPLSWLIYTDQFDALPPPAAEYVSRRLGELLGGKSELPANLSHLTPEVRAAIVEIVRQTKPQLAKDW